MAVRAVRCVKEKLISYATDREISREKEMIYYNVSELIRRAWVFTWLGSGENKRKWNQLNIFCLQNTYGARRVSEKIRYKSRLCERV